jgi:site-specific recombinase XerD
MAIKKKKTEKKHRGVYEKEPGSHIWWIRYQADGKIKREKVGRKQDAIDLYQERKSAIRAGVKLPANLRHKGETLGKIIDTAITWHESRGSKSLRTTRQQLRDIKAALGSRIAADLKPADVDSWLSAHDAWTPATKNRYKSALGKALQLAVVAGHLPRNVARLVTARAENNARVRWMRPEEEERVVKVMRESCPGQLPAFYVALNTGMRMSEQFGLTWDRVDFERRKLFLSTTKNGESREVPMNKTVLALLTDLHTAKTGPHVFPTERNYKEARALLNPRQWFEIVLAEAKVENFHWHDLRHTFASRLVMKGIDLHTVSKLMGHKTLTVTQRYAHLSPEHNLAAVEVLDVA